MKTTIYLVLYTAKKREYENLSVLSIYQSPPYGNIYKATIIGSH